MAPPDMFTPEEAYRFVSEQLGVKNARDRVQSDPRGLLDDITTAIQTQLPFNNMNLLRVSVEDRRRPTLEEIKSDVLCGMGGLCYGLNVANFYILKALGFDVVLVLATCGGTPDNHVIVFARDVERPGDSFLLEAGVGYPTFRAVSLDFERASPVFRDSFLEYKYVKQDGKVLRVHGENDLGGRRNVTQKYIDGWRIMYSAESSGTSNIEDIYSQFDAVYTKPDMSSFHLTFRLLQFPNRRFVAISNQKLILEGETGELETSSLEGGDEVILAAVRRYFPAIPMEVAKVALANWRSVAIS